MNNPWIPIVMVGLTACSASPTRSQAPLSDDEEALLRLDAEHAAYIAETALPSEIGVNASAIKEPLEKKVRGLQELEQDYEPFATSQDPVARAHAHLRVGQLYLNFGCELATIEASPTMPAEVGTAFRSALADQARPMVDKARAALQKDHEGGGEYQEQLVELREGWSDDLGRLCTTTKAAWAAASRPKAPAVAEPTVEECMGETYAPAGRCVPVYEAACRREEGDACYALGKLAFAAGDREAAVRQWEDACAVGSGIACHAAASVALPDGLDGYVETCRNGGPIGCMQAARLHGGTTGLEEICLPKRGLAAHDVGTMEACAAGDARACWSRAGHLMAQSRSSLPKIEMTGLTGSLVGGMGSSGTHQWEKECAETNAVSCTMWGSALARAGEDPVPAYRRGCQLGHAWGCTKLSDALIARGDDDSVGEAVAVLRSSCDDGNTTNCRTLAKLFREEGGPVRRNDGCAAAYGFGTCDPNNQAGCEVDDVFWPSSKGND